MRTVIFAIALLAACTATAEDRLIRLETARPGVDIAYFWMPQEKAAGTLLLITGGGGSIGLKDGVPTSGNFLIRSRELFRAAGFNVALAGRPSDRNDLDTGYRATAEHVDDLRRMVARIKTDSALPVWLVGTSRGTVSATAAAIGAGQGELAGIVLTSSVLGYKWPGAVPTQALDRIRIPVLVVHHEKDGCKACAPHEVPNIARGLTNAPVVRTQMVSGGSEPRGDPCEAFHHHGFVGAETEAVRLITDWVRRPVP